MKLLTIAICLMLMVCAQVSEAGQTILTLERSIEIALENNRSLAIARQEKERAQEVQTETFGLALPNLDLTAEYTRQMDNPKVDIFGDKIKLKPDDNYAFRLKLDQYLYSGSVSSGYRAMGHLVGASDHNINATANSIIALVKERYYNALFSHDLIKVNEESMEQLRILLADSKDREAVGLNTKYDTMRLETRLAAAEPDLISAKNRRDNAVLGLLDILGFDPSARVELAGVLEYKPMVITLEQAIANAKEKRQEIWAEEERVNSAGELVTAAKGNRNPTVKAFANYQYSNLLGFGEDTEWADDWNVGLTLDLPIMDGNERSSRVKQQLIDLRIARIRREETQRAVVLEVKSAYNELMRADEFVRSQRKSVGFAEETYSISVTSNKEGFATQLELLDSQLDLTRAKTNHKQSIYEYSLAKVRLFKAMGMANE